QIFYMSSFFYTLNYVWVLYTGLKGVYYRRMNGCPMQVGPKSTEITAKQALFPVMLMVPVLTVGNSDECYTNFSQPYKCLLMHTGALYPTPRYSDEPTSCYVVHIYGIAVFLVTFLLTFLGIVVLMGKARSLYKRCMDSSGYFGDRQWATLRVLEHRMVLYPSAFFFCWGPAIFLAILILFSPKTVEGEVGVFLYILQAFTSASQGLLNCLVYGWTQQQFCSLSRGAMRDVDTQTPLLRSQKKSYAALPTRGTNT
ncbi:transmembrane protein 116 isoform X1, partial [Arapaima gigas]